MSSDLKLIVPDNAKELGIRSSDIYKVCRGERKTSHGYIWKYK